MAAPIHRGTAREKVVSFRFMNDEEENCVSDCDNLLCACHLASPHRRKQRLVTDDDDDDDDDTGTQETEVVCVLTSSGTQVVVTPDNCQNALKPRIQRVSCNNDPCPPG